MIQICGERLSRRLGRRMYRVSQKQSCFEADSLSSRWMERINRRIQKIVYSLSHTPVESIIVLPLFLGNKSEVSSFGNALVLPKLQEQSTLFVGCIFALFVSIFYQSSKEPALDKYAGRCTWDEQNEDCSSFSFSFLFLRLCERILTYCSFNRIFVMEKSYV